MDYIQLLRELEQRFPAGKRTSHNIALNDGEPQVNIFVQSEGWKWIVLEEEDKQKSPEALAEEIRMKVGNV